MILPIAENLKDELRNNRQRYSTMMKDIKFTGVKTDGKVMFYKTRRLKPDKNKFVSFKEWIDDNNMYELTILQISEYYKQYYEYINKEFKPIKKTPSNPQVGFYT